MNELFEIFVAKSLAQDLTPSLRVDAQAAGHLDRMSHVSIIPDVILRRGSPPVAVLDTKYKKLDGSGDFVNHFLYQVLAYCTALRVDKGMLIYPSTLWALNKAF